MGEGFKDMLIVEQSELWTRINSLLSFIESDKFRSLSEDMRICMICQCMSMRLYNYSLSKRMKLLGLDCIDDDCDIKLLSDE